MKNNLRSLKVKKNELEQKVEKYAKKSTFFEGLDKRFGHGKNKYYVPYAAGVDLMKETGKPWLVFFTLIPLYLIVLALETVSLPLTGLIDLSKSTGLWGKLNARAKSKYERKLAKVNKEIAKYEADAKEVEVKDLDIVEKEEKVNNSQKEVAEKQMSKEDENTL